MELYQYLSGIKMYLKCINTRHRIVSMEHVLPTDFLSISFAWRIVIWPCFWPHGRLSEDVLLGAPTHRSGHLKTLLGSPCLVAEEEDPFALAVAADTDAPA